MELSSSLSWSKWNEVGRPYTYWGKHPKLKSVGSYLRSIKPHIRGLCRKEYRRRLQGHPSKGIAQTREILADSVFTIMDRYESKNDGTNSYDAEVLSLRVVLNLLHDDLGWNK